MCGIVGAASQRNIYKILIEGLRRLEYRGYDSAGLSIIEMREQRYKPAKLSAEVAESRKSSQLNNLSAGNTGISHTRWATHGEPSSHQLSPTHLFRVVSVVHNGIIENHDELRTEVKALGYEILSATDTEVIAHLVHHQLKSEADLRTAVEKTIAKIRGCLRTGRDFGNTPRDSDWCSQWQPIGGWRGY